MLNYLSLFSNFFLSFFNYLLFFPLPFPSLFSDVLHFLLPCLQIVSDCGAIGDILYTHHYTNTTSETCQVALYAGTDLDCGSFYYSYMAHAVKHNAVNETAINEALIRLFTARFMLGMFDGSDQCDYQTIPPSSINTPYAQHLALQMARESIVLLKNQNNLLPLSKNITVALIGPQTNASITLLGDYYGTPPYIITALEGVQQKGVKYIYSMGCQVLGNDTSGFNAALAAAKKADIAILFVGLNQSVESEGLDRYNLTLPGVQEDLVRLISSKSGKPVVVVLINGGPVAIDWISENVPAIVEAWYPGQSGGAAIADVLFGDYNPGGRLPVTIYHEKYVNQISMFDMNMRPYPGRTYRYLQIPAIYPFGYGLSYTSFLTQWLTNKTLGSEGEQHPMVLSSGEKVFGRRIKPFEEISFRALVKNTGSRSGDEVTLAFYSHDNSTGCGVPNPIKQLFGFKRSQLKVGQGVELFFSLAPTSVDEKGRKFVCSGIYKVVAGLEKHEGGVSDAPVEYFEVLSSSGKHGERFYF